MILDDNPPQTQSKFFNLDEIAQGVYVAIAIKEKGVIGNAGIIDLGNRTLVFDTFETPIISEDLRIASEKKTSQSAEFVINSHSHPDHWFGNQVFSNTAVFISSQDAFSSMIPYIEEVREDKENPAELEEEVRSLLNQFDTESDEIKRQQLAVSIARWQLYLNSLSDLELKLPDQTFKGNLKIHGNLRSVEIFDSGHVHTPGDVCLGLPREKILFIGDIGFFNEQPYMEDSNPSNWKAFLNELRNSEYNFFVPGHGPIGTKENLRQMVEYIELLETLVSDAVNQGKHMKSILEQDLPEPFATWTLGSSRLEVNCKIMFDQYLESK